MPRRKILPFGAMPRICVMCGQPFRAMTQPEWEHNHRQHMLLSKKHNSPLYKSILTGENVDPSGTPVVSD
jgi:hypothetical protein